MFTIRIDVICITPYNMSEVGYCMPKRPREMEKEILDDGWIAHSSIFGG